MVKVQDSSTVINGLNTNDLSLNSSRSRLRRDSGQSKSNGRSSSSEENSPITQRRNINNSPARRSGTSKAESPAIKPAEIAPKKTAPRDVRKKKGESFVLDVNSIMDELLASSESHTEDDDEPEVSRATQKAKETPKPSSSRSVRSNGIVNGVEKAESPKLEPPPPAKSKPRKLEMETITKTSVSLVDDKRLSSRKEKETPQPAEKPLRSPSRKLAAKPSDAPRFSAGENKEISSSRDSSSRESSLKELRESSSRESSLRESSSRGLRESSLRESSLRESSLRESSSRESSVMQRNEANRSSDSTSTPSLAERRRKSEAATSYLAARKAASHDTKREEPIKEESKARTNQSHNDDGGFATRSRANALDAKRKTSVEKPPERKGMGFERKDSDQFDEDGLSDVTQRTRAGSNVKRSGSFNLHRQMSGDKALGMFYHNRRSQMMDGHETGDEGDRLSLERSGSFSSPQSPVAARAAVSRLRDSGDFNTSSGNMPMSPLLSSSADADTMSEGLRGVRRTERAERAEAAASGASSAGSGAPPLSPRIVVNADGDKSDVSP